MKNNFYNNIFGLILIASAFINDQATAQTRLVNDTVIMSPGYANEVYYSMANGKGMIAPRDSWDIAFRTSLRSSSILINDGAGVTLWSYRKTDTTGWNSVDTTGLSAWTPMYNDPDDWENGAFSRHAGSFPDYGWGKYNEVTHDLLGDSIFIIRLRDASFRKIWIVRKRSVLDIYVFKYANLDGSNEQQFSLNLNPFIDRDFYGFSIETNIGVDFEPPKADWDILFTKYMSVQPDGTPYPVTGVLSNDGVKSKAFHHTSPDYIQWWVNPWDSLRSSIGYDWKSFDMNTFTYKVEDSLVYFVRSLQGDVYKLIFTKFEGSATGVIVFEKEKISNVGINNPKAQDGEISIYPNPAREFINVTLLNPSAEDQTITLRDLTGSLLYTVKLPASQQKTTIDVSHLASGVYFITAGTVSGSGCKKLVISR
jgi:hypothetical protein